jgi:hypothetical protein
MQIHLDEALQVTASLDESDQRPAASLSHVGVAAGEAERLSRYMHLSSAVMFHRHLS